MTLHLETIRQFLSAPQVEDEEFLEFLIAAAHGEKDVLRSFISHRANEINRSDTTFSISATHLAAEYGQYDALKFLIEKGATLGRETRDKKHELHYGIDNLEITKLILEHRPDLLEGFDIDSVHNLKVRDFLEDSKISQRRRLAVDLDWEKMFESENRHSELDSDSELNSEKAAHEIASAADYYSAPSSSPSTSAFKSLEVIGAKRGRG